jgi:hypothetical protein
MCIMCHESRQIGTDLHRKFKHLQCNSRSLYLTFLSMKNNLVILHVTLCVFHVT